MGTETLANKILILQKKSECAPGLEESERYNGRWLAHGESQDESPGNLRRTYDFCRKAAAKKSDVERPLVEEKRKAGVANCSIQFWIYNKQSDTEIIENLKTKVVMKHPRIPYLFIIYYLTMFNYKTLRLMRYQSIISTFIIT